MSELIQKLEELFDHAQSQLGEPSRADALYEKILVSISHAIAQGRTFDANGTLTVYTIVCETNLLTNFEDDEQHRNLGRLNYIKTNKSYLEWYFTKKLGVPGYRFLIVVCVVSENSLLNKKQKQL